MRVADAVAQWLVDRGITLGFGIIGGGNVVLWDAIAKLGKTQIVCVHHEQAAAMAASYYARTSRRVGFCLVTTGAGSANAITGVMAAHMDGTPLLVISGNENSKYMGKRTRVWGVQGYASAEAAVYFTKEAQRLMSPSTVVANLDSSLEYAKRAPQGPSWIDLPKDIQGAELQ